MSTGLCLVTRGMVCVPYKAEIVPLLSCDEPVVTSALEVRPRIRSVHTPAPPSITAPIVTSTRELRPVMRDADAPAPASPDLRPKPIVTIELKPVIKKADED